MANLKDIYSKPDRIYFFGVPIDVFKSSDKLISRFEYLISHPYHSMVIFVDFRSLLKFLFFKTFRRRVKSSSLVFSNSKLLRSVCKFFRRIDIGCYDANTILLVLMSVLENTYKTCYIIDKDKIISKKNFLRLKESHKEINFIGYYDFKAVKRNKEMFFANINKLTPSMIISFYSNDYLENLFYVNKFGIRTNLSVFL
ncbi:hypothetical protein CDQ96_01745 [Borrelia miyamotoi]|uniref:Uncharacterized protein n=1 Tax=Borrelia miyamotoi TaxID=47466 RepID=A0AAQ2WWD4_9SPIR|nr:hypothetical protein [Borrelia miyamotoi]AGT27347.1 hypothetical protein I871_01855 [Borrelia miyamotoi LB-2001]AJA58527.1 hypothetical protein RJ61_01730 [Borrelia miyamotoi]AOW95604.1 hypothetical protein AXH25_01740 [Borrelia miyamotoi]ASQ29150.1 hypothetical protein CDQ96_01745 [Borrelia miyamotoi]QTL83489.1 hypothetical protein bmLB2001_000345 [Borrelia miyamotoi]